MHIDEVNAYKNKKLDLKSLRFQDKKQIAILALEEFKDIASNRRLDAHVAPIVDQGIKLINDLNPDQHVTYGDLYTVIVGTVMLAHYHGRQSKNWIKGMWDVYPSPEVSKNLRNIIGIVEMPLAREGFVSIPEEIKALGKVVCTDKMNLDESVYRCGSPKDGISAISVYMQHILQEECCCTIKPYHHVNKKIERFKQTPFMNRAVDVFNETALYHAAAAGDLAQVKKILTLGTDPNKRIFVNNNNDKHIFYANSYCSGIVAAAASHHHEVVKVLANWPMTNKEDIATVIHDVIFNKDRVLMEFFLDPKFVNLKTQNGNTPLHWAVLYGQNTYAESLLAQGADPNAENAQAQAPFNIAMDRQIRKEPILDRLMKEMLLAKSNPKPSRCGLFRHHKKSDDNLVVYFGPRCGN